GPWLSVPYEDEGFGEVHGAHSQVTLGLVQSIGDPRRVFLAEQDCQQRRRVDDHRPRSQRASWFLKRRLAFGRPSVARPTQSWKSCRSVAPAPRSAASRTADRIASALCRNPRSFIRRSRSCTSSGVAFRLICGISYT